MTKEDKTLAYLMFALFGAFAITILYSKFKTYFEEIEDDSKRIVIAALMGALFGVLSHYFSKSQGAARVILAFINIIVVFGILNFLLSEVGE